MKLPVFTFLILFFTAKGVKLKVMRSGKGIFSPQVNFSTCKSDILKAVKG